MNQKYFKNIPDDILTHILMYYMIGLRHRTNIGKIKELIKFTHAEPQIILSKGRYSV